MIVGDVYRNPIASPGWRRIRLTEDLDGDVVEAEPLEPLPHWKPGVRCLIRTKELLGRYEMEEPRGQLDLFGGTG